jgi:hypothetical protein
LFALRPLVGCDPHAAAFSVAGQFLKLPPPRWPGLEQVLLVATPWLVGLVLALVATAAWRDRYAWRALFALHGDGPTPPTVLAFTGLAVTLMLYLLQSTSSSRASIRYLLPAWIFLPGLLAAGLRAWPRPARLGAASLMVGLWAASEVQLWADLDQPSPLRPVIQELERRGTRAIVASAHVVLIVADLTQARIAGLEYRSAWPRLRGRYAQRFIPGQPIVCVNDLEYGRPPIEDVGLRMRTLAHCYPGRVRRIWRQGQFEIWEANVPMEKLMDMALDPCPPSQNR